jgi:hypothetical protein
MTRSATSSRESERTAPARGFGLWIASAEAREAPCAVAGDQDSQAFVDQRGSVLHTGESTRLFDQVLIEFESRSHLQLHDVNDTPLPDPAQKPPNRT